MKRFSDSNSPEHAEASLRIVSAWDQLQGTLRQNMDVVHRALGFVTRNELKIRSSARNFSVEAEHEVSKHVPDVVNALDCLRRALTYLDDHSIEWWHHSCVRNVRVPDPEMLEDIVSGEVLIEDQVLYYRSLGKVVGSQVSFDSVFLGLSIWVEVEHMFDNPVSINYIFAEMFEIHLDPET